MSGDSLKAAFEAITAEDDGRVCRDIEDAACREEPRNFFTHVLCLGLTKSADSLIDPKLVLSWLLGSAGAPSALIGLLVPVREAGALLPQLFTAGHIRAMPRRKFAWAAGSFVQGLCALGMGLSALALEGASLGVAIVLLLACLALARSVCSVSYKDVLGKTVDKARRGTATGLASSLASVSAVVFAILLASGFFDRMAIVVTALLLAGAFWISAAIGFVTLEEDKGATGGGGNAIREAMANLKLLRQDAQLSRFILTRALLVSTALAPPFMVVLGGTATEGFGGLGFLVFASALANLVSGYVWGRLADRSSRKVLILSGLVASSILAASAFFSWTGGLSGSYGVPVLLFGLMLAYNGVRLGRSTHLIDMAGADSRAAYTALSNTIIGLVLLLGSGFGLLAGLVGTEGVLLIFALMAGAAAVTGLGLEEVQG